ncbi:ABC transporter permease [Streptomyces sp. NPDC058746]|uniref:ABC transporter permease n=1 Tax=Streptomyces sp. NPDC058746 TaxID=3346622 RepID=UPI0036950FEB
MTTDTITRTDTHTHTHKGTGTDMSTGTTMGTHLRSELRKLTTTRLWWILLLAVVVGSAGLTALVVSAGLGAPMSPLSFGSAAEAVPAYNLAVALAYVFPLAIGVVMVTQEYGSRTITATLLSEPRRMRVFGAKVLVGLCTAFVYGAVSVAGSALVAAALLSGHGEPAYLTDPAVLSALAGSVVVMTLWGAIGVGLGALVRNQAVAIVGILLMTQFVEPTLRILASAMGHPGVGNFLPGGAGDTAAGGTIMTAAAGAEGAAQPLGFLVLALYAVAVAALGGLRFNRYEVA